jgi:glycosyltransferase involved in cell wall biosynthesis
VGVALTIIHTEASDGWGGQEIRILSEAQWFREQGHRVIIVAPAHAQLQTRAREAGFETHNLAFTKASQTVDFFRLARLIGQIRPHVIGTHSSVDSWVGLLAGCSRQVPVRLRYRHVSTAVKANVFNRFLYHFLCHHTLTTGECIRQPLIQVLGVPPSRVTSVPTGIKPPPFHDTSEACRAAVCREFQLPPDSRLLGCVAVLRSWKGQRHLMRAFQTLSHRFPKHFLLLVGDGPGWQDLHDGCGQMPARDRIIFTGHQADPWRFFRAFDAAILPSTKNEGIPQSLLQAMFSGCPVIGSRVGGIPEIVRQGVTGLLVEPAAPEELAAAIQSVLTQPEAAQERARSAQAWVREEFTLERMGQKVLRIIEQCLLAPSAKT